MITIEKSVAMPNGRCLENSKLGELRAAYRRMEVGDSFVFMANTQDPHRAAIGIGARVRTRKLETGGWRVWLLAKPTL